MLGDRIKDLRISYSLNQVQLGKKLHVSKQTISNWENNNIPPSIDTLERLADFFCVSTDFLLERENKRTLDIDGLTEVQIAHIQNIIKDIIEARSKGPEQP